MSAEKTRKTNKGGLTTLGNEGWLSPLGRMDEMFEDFFRRPFARQMWPTMPRMMEELETSPSVDIFEEGDNIVMKCEMPGMTKDDIELNLTENMITISGEKKKEEKIDKKNYYRLERSCGSFRRSFALPADVQSDKAKATFKDGILEVKIPKTMSAKKKEKKIKID